MIRTPRKPIRPEPRRLSSAAPALAGAIAAAAFVLGGGVFAVFHDEADAAPVAGPIAAADTLAEPPESGRVAAPSRGLAALPAAHEIIEAPVRRPIAVSEDAPALRPVAARVEDGPVIAIVIDDAGLDVEAAQRAIHLPADITLAILPYAEAAADIAGAALSDGDEVFVHMPMEPLGLEDPGPGALTRHLPEPVLSARVRAAFARVPGATGMNNHMGSAFTADARAMRVALSALDDDALFLDSVTSGASRAAAVAEGLGLTALSRDVFIDHVDARAVIETRLDEAEALARRQGVAIAIGHPRDLTLEALEGWMPAAQARGVRFVTLSGIAAGLASRETTMASAGDVAP